MTAYFDAIHEVMAELAAQPGAIFIGQSVVAGGTAMHRTLDHIPEGQRLELPVFEDTQMGMATGLALAGYLPICIYPRINFLLLTVNQLVLHLDALPIYSDGGCNPRVVIRTAVATPNPLDPGPQHLGDYSHELELMMNSVRVVRLRRAEQIIPAYRTAVERNGSTLLVEYSELY